MKGFNMQDKGTNNAALFEVTQKLLSYVEQQLVRTSIGYHWLNFVLKNTVFPSFFLMFGLEELFRPLKTWGIIFFVLLIAAFLAIGTHQEQENAWVSACFFVSIILVMYALPSSYAFDSTGSSAIAQIKKFINERGVKTEKEIKVLADNIFLLKPRVYARINFFKWLLGVCWALSLFIFNQFNSIALKIDPETLKDTLGQNIASLMMFGIFTLFILCSIVSYKKANDAVFSRISLALNESLFEIALKEKSSTAYKFSVSGRKKLFKSIKR